MKCSAFEPGLRILLSFASPGIELSSLFKDIFLKYGFFFGFSLSLEDVNATVFLDYLPITPSQFPKSLVFPAGVTSIEEILTFEIINDAAREEDEVFKLELSLDGTSQSTATIGNQDTLIVVIKDDDPIESAVSDEYKWFSR